MDSELNSPVDNSGIELNEGLLDNDQIKNLAIVTLYHLLSDPNSNVRASAARTLLEALGVLGNSRKPLNQDKTIPVSQLSYAEIAAQVSQDII